MSFYAQSDTRWSKMLLGYNTDSTFNLGNWGCLVTAWGNMLLAVTGDQGYTPAMVNKWMQDHNGFLKGGGLFIWNTALGMGHVQFVQDTTSMGQLTTWLKEAPNFAIIKYRLKNGQEHYCLGHKQGFMIDSQDGKEKPIGFYAFVGAKLYKAVGGKGSTQPVQEAGVETKEQLEQRLLHGPGGVDDWTNKHAMAMRLLAESQQRERDLQGQVATLLAQVSDWRATYRKDPAIFIVRGDHAEPDYAEIKPDYQLTDGMIFRRAGVFVGPDGRIKARTHISVANGDWYGADPDWLELVPGSEGEVNTSAIHVTGAMAVGLLKRIEVMVKNTFKGNDKELS